MGRIDLGTFSAEVVRRPDGLFDAYVSSDGSAGYHYTAITAEKIGSLVAEEIECVAENYIDD